MRERVLLIAPKFFGYYQKIANEITKLGYKVDYINDEPNDSNIYKAIARVNKKILSYSIHKYFNNIVLPQVETISYNKILVIGGMTFSFTPNMIHVLRKLNKNAKFYLYQWDSERNLPYVTKIHKYFDHIFTFDRYDASFKPEVYKFLPLFYTNTYKKIGDMNVTSYKYDCMYVGTAHPRKYKEITQMSEKLNKVFKNQYIYQYMPSKLKYIYHKFFSPEYKHAKYSTFKTKKLSSKQMFELLQKSRCVLDAPQAGQSGITMRTIECLGAKKKLITSNSDIINYDFYCPENIYIYDGDFDFNSVFFNKGYKNIDQNIYEKYSLRNWIKTIFEIRD